MEKRKFGLDLVRAVALFFVILVHSFLNSGYNKIPLNTFGRFSLLSIRCLAFVGVLMFIILTGYLKADKKLDKNHYKSIIKILIVYLIVSILSIVFRKFIFLENISLTKLVLGIFNFSAAPYAWYVEMYIGLFLMIPFLNIIYKNLDTKRKKQILLITFFALGSLFPTISRIKINGVTLGIMPDWWAITYPISLYYIGCYIKDYQPNINKLLNFILIIVSVLLQAVIYYFYAQGGSVKSISIGQNSAFAVILATLVFLFLYNIKTNNKPITSVIRFISNVTFGAYLISYCYDALFYKLIPLFDIHSRYYMYECTFLLTPIVLVCSIISSYLINLIIDLVTKLFKKIIKKKKKNNKA